MIKFLQDKPSWKVLLIVSIVAAVFNHYVSAMLQQAYAASKFPVPYFEAQLSFSADKLKGWYEFLVQHDTMGLYIYTQNFDFIFMLSVLLLHAAVILLISRGFALSSRLRKVFVYAAVLSASAPILDALENGVSYIMLANHSDFASWLAIVYSSFAAAKFAMFTFAYVAAPIGILLVIVVKVKGLMKQSAPSAASDAI